MLVFGVIDVLPFRLDAALPAPEMPMFDSELRSCETGPAAGLRGVRCACSCFFFSFSAGQQVHARAAGPADRSAEGVS